MERSGEKPNIVLSCIVCIPDMKCEAIGVLGKIQARIIDFPYLKKRTICWERIEECQTRKLVMEAHAKHGA